MAASDISPQSEYIQHHLVHLNNVGAKQSAIANFSFVNYDSLFWSILTGLVVVFLMWRAAKLANAGVPGRRSEEHTSELQSLMRISYAVFCLNKKHNEIDNDHNQ